MPQNILAEKRRERFSHYLLISVGLFIIIAIIWLDITTSVWQNLVILAGLAVGFVTFMLTALVFNRIIARNQAKRWAPMTLIALTDILHGLADEQSSEISRGRVSPRQIGFNEDLHALRISIVHEQKQLQNSISKWAAFLSASDATEVIMPLFARLALQLDTLRDLTIEFEKSGTNLSTQQIEAEVNECNKTVAQLTQEIKKQISIAKKVTPV